jgi:hypothetical protein
MYTIEKILDKQGNERIDGRYPQRKGCQGEILFLAKNVSMIFNYHKDADGNPKGGLLSTSPVEDFHSDGDGLIVQTENSTYYLVK